MKDFKIKVLIIHYLSMKLKKLFCQDTYHYKKYIYEIKKAFLTRYVSRQKNIITHKK